MRERSDRPVALAGSSGEIVARGRGARWPWLIVVIAVGAANAAPYASLVNHPVRAIVALAVGLGFSILRMKPVAIAAFAAGIVAFALALHPVLAGVGLGVGAFVLLIALFFTISTVLHARQRHRQRA
ncbi:MAG TPA: hypothetical protein VJ741_19980 [Solirubrobacteraceae bacterium]|nr:hypothetical protein [Solirubrobacteraceae bacterium]